MFFTPFSCIYTYLYLFTQETIGWFLFMTRYFATDSAKVTRWRMLFILKLNLLCVYRLFNLSTFPLCAFFIVRAKSMQNCFERDQCEMCTTKSRWRRAWAHWWENSCLNWIITPIGFGCTIYILLIYSLTGWLTLY
jgi:hypothetical protein